MVQRIVLTGGGTRGHIYPLFAVAEQIAKESQDDILMYYIGPKNESVFDEFKKNNIRPYPVLSSKLRRYISPLNLLDIPKFFFSIFQMLWRIYSIMPDVVFSKGGPGSFPVVFASWFYMIPVVIHESDSVPSLNAKLAMHFAKRIGISFETALQYFPKNKVAFTGNPVREELIREIPDQKIAKENLGFNLVDPLIVILGGSQGSLSINDFIFTNLKELIKKYQVFHQVGQANEGQAQSAIASALEGESDETKRRYQYSGFMDAFKMKKILASADIVVSRSGSNALYEISAFGKPAILIPLPKSAGNHQLVNAYEYEKSGRAVVIEEANFSFNLFIQEVDNILGNNERLKLMGERAKTFFRPDATTLLAEEVLRLANK